MRSISLLLLGGLLLAGCASTPGNGLHIQDIHGLALDPQTPTRLFVATHHGLFVGEDDKRWSSVTHDPFDMMGFTMHPTNPQIMYASGHPGRIGQGWAVGVVKSADGGKTWSTLSLKNEVDFHAMSMEGGKDGLDAIYGFYKNKFYASNDGGTNWQNAAVPFAASAFAVEPSNGTVYAATDKGLQKTGRLGSGGWSVLTPGETMGVATSPLDPSLLVVYFASGGLKESRDGGATWRSLNWTVPEDDHPWGLAIHPTNENVLYAGTLRGAVFKTEDGGSHWSKIR